MIMDAKLKLEDSQRAAFTGDMTAAAQRRSEAIKEARDAEKMLIDAGFKQEEINRLRENAERDYRLNQGKADLAERQFQQTLQEYKEGPERAKALAKYKVELERQNRAPTMQEIAMYGLTKAEQAALARSVITQKGQGSDRRLTQKEATEIVDNRIARDPNIIKNQQKRDKDAGKPIRDEDTIRRDLINEELTASEAFGGIAGAPRSNTPTSHPADKYK
jgi:hypothetical protein